MLSKNAMAVKAVIEPRKICVLVMRSHMTAASSITKSMPPIGEPNAAATPHAAPAVM